MAFPGSPSNGQIATVNNITYVYSSTSNAWTKSTASNVTIGANTVATSTTTGALTVAGGAGIAGNVFAGSVYTDSLKFANGSSYSSTTIANTTEITANAASGYNVGLSLAVTGVSAGNYGSATSIPTIVVDSKGRITSITANTASTTVNLAGTTGTGSVASGSTLTLTGGTGITTSVTGSTFTITNSGVTSLSSSGTGNITVSASTGSVTLALPPTGPGATTVGSATAIPVITTDAYGRITALTTASPTFASITKTGTTGTGDIGQSNNTFGTVYATTFSGVSTTAKYADLAEVYTSDKQYLPGTVVVFGGTSEVTTTTKTHDTRVAGVVSTNPAYLMNSEATGLPIAFTGRVPCLVCGPVSKGDVLVTSAHERYAERLSQNLYQPGCILGKALGEVAANEFSTIEVVVGRF